MKQELLNNFDVLSKQNMHHILKYNLRIMQQSEYLFQIHNDVENVQYISSVMIEAISQMDILCFRDSNFVNKVFPVLKKIFLTISNNGYLLTNCSLILLECIKFFIHHSYTFIFDPNALIERFFSIYWTHLKTNVLLHLELLNTLIINHSFIIENDLIYIYKYAYKTIFHIFSIIPYKVYHLVLILLPCLINENSFTDILMSLSDTVYTNHVNNFLKIYFSTITDEYMQVLIPIMIDSINNNEMMLNLMNQNFPIYEDVIVEQLTKQVHKVIQI